VVWRRHGIALGNPLRLSGSPFFHHAMGAQPAIPADQYHVSDVNMMWRDAIDDQRVSGPD
jgi:hypothetical protein